MKPDAAAKRFSPLFLVAALWLVILAVPALNLLFRVQLGGSTLVEFSALPSRDHALNFWEKSAQRFPNDVPVLWQAAGEYPVSEKWEDDESTSDAEAPIIASPSGIAKDNAARISRPDPSVPSSQVFPGQLAGEISVEKQRRLDLLITRFPRNADLLAARLRATFGRMGNGRIGGELSDPNSYQNQAAGIPSPEKSKEKPNYTSKDLEKAIALARRGSGLEPDNGFFDWMECCFLMLAWRDGEAFQALDNSAKKTRFDDHSLAEQNARLTALSIVFNRKLLTEEKLHDYYENALFPQYARYREMARILSWQSIKAQRKGDHKKALRIAAGLARTAARMRENSKTYIEGLVASAIESIAWGGLTSNSRRGFGRRRLSTNQRISSIRTYATKYGRPELAAEAARNYAAGVKFRNRVSGTINNGIGGTPFWVFILISLSWTSGVLLLLLLPMSLLLPAILWTLGRVPRVRGVLRWEESNVAETASSREVWNGALACGGVRALGAAISGAMIVGLAWASLMIGVGQIEPLFKGIASFWNEIISDNGSYVGMQGVYYLLASSHAPQSFWRWIVALSPLLFGILFVAWRATEWQKVRNNEQLFSSRAFFQSLLQGHAFRSPSGARDDLDVTAAFLKILDWFLMLLLIGSWWTLAFIAKNETSQAWLIPFVFSLLFSGVLFWEKIAIWRARPRRRQTVRYGLRLLKRSFLAWLVLGSALYFVLLLGSLPLRQNVEWRVERVLRLGEVGASSFLSP